MKKILFIFFLSLLVTTLQSARSGKLYTVETVPNDQLQDATDFVTNPDGIISSEAEYRVNSIIASIRDSATVEIAVVLINSIGSKDIDSFATDLFTKWGIGKREKDNGLLFLLVYDQKQMVFRTGYGLEGVLPDIVLGQIIRNDISPYLKQGDFDSGIINGMEKISSYLLDTNAVEEVKATDNRQMEDLKKYSIGYLGITVVVFLLFLVFLLSVLNSSKNNYKKYSLLNNGRAFVIIGAILFPLLMIIYAIFYFRKRKALRNNPFPCPSCGNMMKKLSEVEEDVYLTKSQQTEETVGSVDYDVWFCGHCGKTEIYPYNKMLSSYSACPQCQAKTYTIVQDRIISRATTVSSGMGERVYSCKNCHYGITKRYTIPRISSSSSGRGGSFGGGGGGGSWGGGRTGGGGARGGW